MTYIDWQRAGALAARPNLRFDTLFGVSGPDDSKFPDAGIIHLRQVVSHGLCDQVVRDYEDFEAIRDADGSPVRDAVGRNYRLANFHLRSRACLEVGLSTAFHEPATAFFGRQSALYTSLTYKHGSQQTAHIDTPFFWTRPFNLFVGVWVAFEDVQADAGPLFYYPGSHREFASEDALRTVHAESGGSVSATFERMLDVVGSNGPPERALIRKGDAVIWHPGLMHGGTLATNTQATRFSTVFHFAPVGVNVRPSTFPNNFANLPYYGLKQDGGRFYCQGKQPHAMI